MKYKTKLPVRTDAQKAGGYVLNYTPHYTRPTSRTVLSPPHGWTTHQPNPRQNQTSLHVWQTVTGYARCLSRDRCLSVLFVDPQQRPPELFWLPTYYSLYDQSIGARSTLRVLVVLTYIAQKQAAITTKLSFQVFYHWNSFLIFFLPANFPIHLELRRPTWVCPPQQRLLLPTSYTRTNSLLHHINWTLHSLLRSKEDTLRGSNESWLKF